MGCPSTQDSLYCMVFKNASTFFHFSWFFFRSCLQCRKNRVFTGFFESRGFEKSYFSWWFFCFGAEKPQKIFSVYLKKNVPLAHSRAEARLLQQPSTTAPSAHLCKLCLLLWNREFYRNFLFHKQKTQELFNSWVWILVARKGFEPPTLRVWTACSSQLSYLAINGTYRARTYDPLLVRQMLSQLS